MCTEKSAVTLARGLTRARRFRIGCPRAVGRTPSRLLGRCQLTTFISRLTFTRMQNVNISTSESDQRSRPRGSGLARSLERRGLSRLSRLTGTLWCEYTVFLVLVTTANLMHRTGETNTNARKHQASHTRARTHLRKILCLPPYLPPSSSTDLQYSELYRIVQCLASFSK